MRDTHVSSEEFTAIIWKTRGRKSILCIKYAKGQWSDQYKEYKVWVFQWIQLDSWMTQWIQFKNQSWLPRVRNLNVVRGNYELQQIKP